MGRQPLPTNTILGNGSDQYRIDTVLGPGGFGITYLARDQRFDRDVAIKEYFPAEFAYREGSTTIRSLTRTGDQNYFEQGKRHFLEEARTLAKFRHEHIVRVLNLFEQFNTAYMVLEFEEGPSLKAWLRALGRPAAQSELDGILDPLLSALDLVHAKGMFHRDIAPDNIIMRPNGMPVLIDFGAARHFVREHSRTIGAIVKHGFSPPEQYTLDTRLQGAWSDIYALSATMFAALVGRAPEEASRRQIQDTVLPVAQHIGPHRRQLYRPSFLAALDAGLALKIDERPQSIAAFRSLVHGEQEAVPVVERRAPALREDGAGEGGRETVRSSEVTLAAAARSAVVRDARPLAPAGSHPLPQSAVRAAALAPAAASSQAREGPGVVLGITALAVALVAALVFLWIGGIGHPGGRVAALSMCAGLIVAGVERTVTLARSGGGSGEAPSTLAPAMFAAAFAIFWLPFFFWQLSIVLAVLALVLWGMSRRGWVPIALLGLALLQLLAAALLIVAATRSVQQDPLFLPVTGTTLSIVAGLALAVGLQLQRRVEAVEP